jgi:hypothetical protein
LKRLSRCNALPCSQLSESLSRPRWSVSRLGTWHVLSRFGFAVPSAGRLRNHVSRTRLCLRGLCFRETNFSGQRQLARDAYHSHLGARQRPDQRTRGRQLAALRLRSGNSLVRMSRWWSREDSNWSPMRYGKNLGKLGTSARLVARALRRTCSTRQICKSAT